MKTSQFDCMSWRDILVVPCSVHRKQFDSQGWMNSHHSFGIMSIENRIQNYNYQNYRKWIYFNFCTYQTLMTLYNDYTRK